MSRKLTTVVALNEALGIALESDPDVILLGEDLAGGGRRDAEGVDEVGGVMSVTRGLVKRFPERVLDTPISEMGILGTAVGAAVTGMRPVAELMFIDFIGVALDPLLNQAAKLRYMFGGKARVPLTVRTLCGAGMQAAAQHSQALYWLTGGIPGLKTVIPSNAADAKGLLLASIRSDDPVVFCEPKAIIMSAAEVPEGDYEIPLGKAAVAREGSDVTLVGLGATVGVALEAAERLAGEGVEAEVVDLRSVTPLDEETILASLEKTGSLVVVDEATPRSGVASDVAALCADRGFEALRSPVRRVTAPFTPVPFAKELEQAYMPSAERVVQSVLELG